MHKEIINIIVSPNSDFDKILARNGRVFNMSITNNTTYIKIPISENKVRHIMFSAFKLKLSDLSFIQSVRSVLNKNKVDKFPYKVLYYKFAELQDGYYDNICEVDLSAAYWFAAKELRYINNELYEKGNLKEKKVRLMALGSAASNKKEYHFDGKQFNKLPSRVNQNGKNSFYNISAYIDMFMLSIYEKYGNAIIGYWTDAFFCDKSIKKDVIKDIENFGAKCKVVDIDALIKGTDKKGVVTIEVYESSGRVKPFIYFNERQKKEIHAENFNRLIKYTGDF